MKQSSIRFCCERQIPQGFEPLGWQEINASPKSISCQRFKRGEKKEVNMSGELSVKITSSIYNTSEIVVKKVHTSENPIDMLNKPFPIAKFEHWLDLVGVHSMWLPVGALPFGASLFGVLWRCSRVGVGFLVKGGDRWVYGLKSFDACLGMQDHTIWLIFYIMKSILFSYFGLKIFFILEGLDLIVKIL